jgi:hypothetical protein
LNGAVLYPLEDPLDGLGFLVDSRLFLIVHEAI